MEGLLNQIAHCIEFGKVNISSPYPPNMRGQEGANELTKKAVEEGIPPNDILKDGLMPGMEKIGIKFRENQVFVPQVLMSAKAMGEGMEHLKPFFSSGEVKKKGVFIIGTVQGDLHDIGKNLVAMMVEGSGYEVIDLGVDVKLESFIFEIEKNPNAVLGLSALLSTTMNSMTDIVENVKERFPNTKICVGGAPVTQAFCNEIGADNYNSDPQGVVDYLNTVFF